VTSQSYFSDNLIIESVSEADNLFMYELVNSPGWLAFIGDRQVTSPDLATDYIRQMQNNPSIDYYVVRDKVGTRPVGIVSFIKRDYLVAHDLGFAFLPEFTGKGYAFEAAKTLLIAKASEGHRLILATTLPRNKKSVALLLKLGFSFTGVGNNGQDTIHIYSITDDKIDSGKESFASSD
jgi:ribosomal-protein-alanine N-acetyltransferase